MPSTTVPVSAHGTEKCKSISSLVLLQGDLHRDLLYKDAKYKFNKLRDNLAARKQRLRENFDYDFLMDWLLTVRGINTQHDIN